MKRIDDRPFFCSWSGGKDSCLALHRAIEAGGVPKALLTMLVEDGQRSRSHGLPTSVIRAQAESMDIPLVTRETMWDDYEETFLGAIREFRADGIECGVFGDIDLQGHLDWVERVCASADIEPLEPLWKEPRRDLLNDFFSLGFEATVVAAKRDVLDTSFLGRSLNEETVADMEAAGIDVSGEEGEYHTVVTAGPLFTEPVAIAIDGHVARDGYVFAALLG